MPQIIDKQQLANGCDFEGYRYGEGAFSFIWLELAPGEGPALHRHPYQEVLVILEGESTMQVGDQVIHAHAGQVVVVPAGDVHGFVNSGSGVLRQLDIHSRDRFATEWLDEEPFLNRG